MVLLNAFFNKMVNGPSDCKGDGDRHDDEQVVSPPGELHVAYDREADHFVGEIEWIRYHRDPAKSLDDDVVVADDLVEAVESEQNSGSEGKEHCRRCERA